MIDSGTQTHESFTHYVDDPEFELKKGNSNVAPTQHGRQRPFSCRSIVFTVPVSLTAISGRLSAMPYSYLCMAQDCNLHGPRYTWPSSVAEICDNVEGMLVVTIDDLVSSLERAPVAAVIIKISALSNCGTTFGSTPHHPVQ
jgi:hypothetical protein